MARIALIEAENATPEVKEIYEKVLRGKPGNVQKALAHRPEMLKTFLPFYASVGRSLDRKLYEDDLSARLVHQRMPLLPAAPRGVIEAGRIDHGRLESAERRQLLRLRRERAAGFGLRRKADSQRRTTLRTLTSKN